MSWWCHATRQAWNWTPRAYPGIWMAMAALLVAYVVASVRHARLHGLTSADRRKQLWFVLGALLLWASTDWPLGTLGASYLASVHMAQYLLYTLVAAPLLMLGTPEWMVRPIVRRLKIHGALRILARPVVAGVVFNLVLIATHAPWTVDTFRSNQLGSMLLDVIWLLSGFLLWTPLISPLTELRHPSPAVRCIYLFLAAGAVAMLPGGILTFASFPLYRTYELAPRVWDISAEDDQQLAGILMKIGNIPIVWAVIFATFVKWALDERDADARARADAETKNGPGEIAGAVPTSSER